MLRSLVGSEMCIRDRSCRIRCGSSCHIRCGSSCRTRSHTRSCTSCCSRSRCSRCCSSSNIRYCRRHHRQRSDRERILTGSNRDSCSTELLLLQQRYAGDWSANCFRSYRFSPYRFSRSSCHGACYFIMWLWCCSSPCTRFVLRLPSSSPCNRLILWLPNFSNCYSLLPTTSAS